MPALAFLSLTFIYQIWLRREISPKKNQVFSFQQWVRKTFTLGIIFAWKKRFPKNFMKKGSYSHLRYFDKMTSRNSFDIMSNLADFFQDDHCSNRTLFLWTKYNFILIYYVMKTKRSHHMDSWAKNLHPINPKAVSKLTRGRFSQKMNKQICFCFLLFAFSLFRARNKFVCSFFGKIYGMLIWFWFYLTFCKKTFLILYPQLENATTCITITFNLRRLTPFAYYMWSPLII